MHDQPLTDAELAAIQLRVEAASKGPWQSFVEGRDHTSGDDFIRIGPPEDKTPDMYVLRETRPAAAEDLDFIAHARQDIPRLISEIRQLRDSN